MSKDMIEAIGELWLLALVIGATFIIFLFRAQLKTLVDEALDLKLERGETKFALSRGKAGSIPTPQASKGKDETSLGDAEATDSSKQEPSDTDTDESVKMYKIAIADKNTQSMETYYTKIRDKQSDPKDRQGIEAEHYFHLFSKVGSQDALAKLRDLASRNDATIETKRWLAITYEISGNYSDAARCFEEAISAAPDEHERARTVSMAASSLYESGDKVACLAMLYSELTHEHSAESRSELYKCLATIYEKLGEPILRLAAIEKALEGRPNDSGLRFDAAFGYSKISFHRLSLLHYKRHVQFYPKSETSLNNLGVSYSHLNLHGKAVSAYQRSMDLGETLAMANYANKLTTAGFYDEAKKVLDKARLSESVHGNVGDSLSKLAESQNNESQLEEQALLKARDFQMFFIKFADAVFSKNDIAAPTFAGEWKLPDETVISVVGAQGELSAAWEIKSEKHYLKAKPLNNAIIGSIGYRSSNYYTHIEKHLLGYYAGFGCIELYTYSDNDSSGERLTCSIKSQISISHDKMQNSETPSP